MNTNTSAVLKSTRGQAIALKGVQIKAQLQDLMSEVTVTQQYLNQESVNIEAVYTFPLPLDAVLLEMTVKLDGRELRGKIVEKTEAEEAYEEAITDGDIAIMLEQAQPGLYSMNLGNLQAGESASICFRYAMLLRWSGDQVRLMLPTVIAPRYGDAQAAGLEPHQQPEYSLDAEYDYGLSVQVSGLLANAAIQSPTHGINLQQSKQGASIVLNHEVAQLDRDFVLNFVSAAAGKDSALLARDLYGYVTLASFKPEFSNGQDATARNIKVVVDCSGSMNGASIAQAREALLRILDSLRPQDQFGLLKYGSHHVSLFKKQKYADELNLHKARQFVRQLDADMGGTETEGALEMAYRLKGDKQLQPDVLLITDGQIWGGESAVKAARKSGHRLFTIGVGHAAAEGVVRELAEKTGGAYGLVTPGENMAERIHRHFKRIYSPRASDVSIQWPGEPGSVHPKQFKTVYDGDTLHAYAWFKQAVEGEVRLTYTLPDGREIEALAPIKPGSDFEVEQADTEADIASTLARIAIASQLKKLKDEQAATALALEYQLMSEWTNCLVIDKREVGDQAEDLPQLRKVPQMLAAETDVCFSRARVHYSMAEPSELTRQIDDRVFAMLARQQSISEGIYAEESCEDNEAGDYYIALINNLDIGLFIPLLKIDELDVLLMQGDIEEKRNFLRDGLDKASLVILFLTFIAQSHRASEIDRSKRRSISKAFKALSKGHRALLNGLPRKYEIDEYTFIEWIESKFELTVEA